MSNVFTGIGKLRPIQPGDPVASQVIDQPILILARRIEALEALIQQQESTTPQALIIYGVPTDGTVNVDDAVYFNPSTGLYSQALAAVTLINSTFTANPTALSIGIAININGTTADVQVGGIGAWTSNLQPAGMMQLGESFQPGAPYYLSAIQPGKLTRFPPMMRVQVLLSTAANFIVAPLPSIPEAIENNYTVPMGMRPVGALRSLPPDYSKNIIVGFDALENTGSAWQLTSQNANPTLQQFGYMVADAALTALPATPPIYVEIDIDAGGGVVIFSATSLANLVEGGASIFNTQYSTNLSSGNYGLVRNYAILDQSGASLGMLSFKFTIADTAYPRTIVFKIPDSFQGWKMIYAPVNPIAVPVIVGEALQSITMQEHGVGFTVPPAVIITGGGGSNAAGTAVLDVYGSVLGVTVTNGGSGYTSNPTITFDTNLASVSVLGGGDGAAVTVTVTGGVVTAANVTAPGSNYGSAPSLVVMDSGAGHGAILQPVMQNGTLLSVNVLNGGTGYTVSSSPLSPTVVVTPSSFGYTPENIVSPGSGGAVSVTITGGAVTSAVVVSPGSGYTSAPALVVFDPGGGYGAALTATVSGGAITGVAVSALGTDYIQATTRVTVVSTTGTLAKPTLIETSVSPATPATVVVNPTYYQLKDLRILCGGIGYAANATLSLSLTAHNTIYVTSPAEVLAYTDANGSIYQVKIMARGNYNIASWADINFTSPQLPTSSPTEFYITVPNTSGAGAGAYFTGYMATSIASVTVSAPGSGYQSAPEFQFGAALSKINVTLPGMLYQPTLPPMVTLSAPDDTVNGVQATAVAKLGGSISRVNIISGGSGYISTGNYSIVVSSGNALFVPIINSSGVLTSVEIIDPGDSYTVAPVLTVVGVYGSPGSGAIMNCELEASSSVVSIILTNNGNGYTNPPTVTLSAPVDSSGNPILGSVTAQAEAVLAAGPASPQAVLNGQGGSRIAQSSVATTGNNLQIFDFHDDLDSPNNPFPEPQSSSIFYYNIKADPLMTLRFPPNPIDKCQAVCNGVELLTRPYNTATGAYSDPDTDVGISTETPFWTTFDCDGSPWDRNWAQYWQELGVAGNDAVIQNTGPSGYQAIWWNFWENLFKYAANRNKGWMHINKASRFYQTNKITSLGVLSPLRLLDAASGVESANDGSPMTGQLVLAVDAMDNFIGGTGVQIDMMQAGNAQAIYTNNTGVAVGISSVLMLVVFQSTSPGTASASNNTAQITIGTAGGGYRDYVGTSNATITQTWLSQTNQFKEFFPDAGVGAPLLQSGDSLWVNVMQPAGAPIMAQIVVCKVKGFIV